MMDPVIRSPAPFDPLRWQRGTPELDHAIAIGSTGVRCKSLELAYAVAAMRKVLLRIIKHQPGKLNKSGSELIVFLVADFLKPLFESTVYLFWLSVAGLLLCLLRIALHARELTDTKDHEKDRDKPTFEQIREKLGPRWTEMTTVSVFGALFSLVFLAAQTVMGTDDKGVLANLMPRVEALQASVLRLDAKVDARFDNVDAKLDDIRSGTDSLRAAIVRPVVDTVVTVAPRPRLDNEVAIRKELVELGVPWTYAEFWSYLKRRDTLVTSLFVRSGAALGRDEFAEYVRDYYDRYTADLLLKYRAFKDDVCLTALDVKFYDLYEEVRRKPEKRRMFRGLCGAEDMARLDRAIEQERQQVMRARIEYEQLAQSECMHAFPDALQFSSEDFRNAITDEAVDFDMFAPLTYTKRQELLAALKTDLIMRDPAMFEDPVGNFRKKAGQVCPALGAKLRSDPFTLDLLVWTKEMLAGQQ